MTDAVNALVGQLSGVLARMVDDDNVRPGSVLDTVLNAETVELGAEIMHAFTKDLLGVSDEICDAVLARAGDVIEFGSILLDIEQL